MVRREALVTVTNPNPNPTLTVKHSVRKSPNPNLNPTPNPNQALFTVTKKISGHARTRSNPHRPALINTQQTNTPSIFTARHP